MSTSYSSDQGKALERISEAGLWSGEHGFFIEGPRSKGYYGAMSLPTFRMVDENHAVPIGYTRIQADGRISFPSELRRRRLNAGVWIN